MQPGLTGSLFVCVNEAPGGVGTEPGLEEKGSGVVNQKPGWVLILLAWLPSGTLRSPRILSFTNPELSVCYEDLSAEAGGYCMFHLIVCSLDMQLTYNYK